MNTVLDGLASNPALPRFLLARLMVVADDVLALTLARRSDLTVADVEALLARDDPDVVAALLEEGWVRPSDVPASDPRMALVVAEHPDAPSELVRSLAAHPDPVVRVRLARLAHHLPADVASLLARDPDDRVVAELVSRQRPSPRVEPAPSLTEPQIRSLVSQGPHAYLRAARSPHCPPDLLHLMAERAEEAEVHRAIARHPRASGATLLLCLEDPQARHWAAAHPNLPVPKIVELLGSEFTAGPAASNPSLPVAVMEELLRTTT
ncbi:MAG: hypothetical protein QOF58_7784 [Pseudonocardiales bacterium]|nr:hypothetical protein [Pseudonocardiales bacterium]